MTIFSRVIARFPANTKHRPNVETMFGHRLRRWPNIGPMSRVCWIITLLLQGSHKIIAVYPKSSNLGAWCHCQKTAAIRFTNPVSQVRTSDVLQTRKYYILRHVFFILSNAFKY